MHLKIVQASLLMVNHWRIVCYFQWVEGRVYYLEKTSISWNRI